MKKKKEVIVCIVIVTFLIGALIINEMSYLEDDDIVYNVSIITRGVSTESSTILKNGVDQASSEFNVNTKFITLSSDKSIDEQKDFIIKECNGNADAVVIDPVDYESLSSTIEECSKKKNIVLINSNISFKNNIESVSTDDYELGVNLAKEFLKNSKGKERIIMVKNGLTRSSIRERYDGFMNTIAGYNEEILDWELINDDDYYEQSRSFLQCNNVDDIIIFDNSVLKSIGQANMDLNKEGKIGYNPKIYGVGNDSKTVSLLENKYITAIATENEFNTGYLAIKKAVLLSQGKRDDNIVIKSTIVNSDNMYSEENQRLLFLFVK